MYHFNRLLILITAIMLLFSFYFFGTSSADIGIEAALQHELAAGKEQVEVLIHMKDQANTGKVARELQQNSPASFAAGLQKDKLRFAILEELQQTAFKSQDGLVSYLEEKSKAGLVEKFESYYISNMIYARLDAKLVEEIASRPDVRHIYANHAIELELPSPDNILYELPNNEYTWNLELINVPGAWEKYGFDGSGIVIGIIDTGVCLDQPALQNSWRGNHSIGFQSDYNWYDPIDEKELPDDLNGHGTGVLSISMGARFNDNPQTGVAPGAKWIAARGLNDSGESDRQTILKASQFILAPTDSSGKNPRPDLAPDIVINAWGSRLGDDPWFMEIIESWRSANIFPVFAAGNTGAVDNSIHNPANYPDSFAVGAVDKNKKLSSFSSRGPGAFGNMIKPEVVAPGEEVLTFFPNGISSGSGTSFAAPHVAGAAALLLQADSSLQASDLESILKATALSLTDTDYIDSPNYGYGFGLIDIQGALDYLFNQKWIDLDGPQEAVPLNESWRINFNRSYSPQEIVGIAIDSNNVVIPIQIDYQTDEKTAIVTPHEPYEPGKNYELRIYLDNMKRYRVYFQTISRDQSEAIF